MSTVPDAYRAARNSAVFADRASRVRLNVYGPDRAKFLHNLTTQDVKRLLVGRGAEAFVTSPQGKTLDFVTILATEEAISVRSDAGGLGLLLPHLQKYGVFDDVKIVDASELDFEFHVAGPNAEDLVGRAGGPLPESGEWRHGEASIADGPVRIVRESPFGVPGLTVMGPLAFADAVRIALHASGESLGLVDADPSATEALRIESGTPLAGRDVTPENLPQEVGRDARAINFVKGCYLGQETVARIDALGHVNKHLRGLVLDGESGDVPPPGSAIEADGKAVGTVTSSAFSPGLGRPVALGYLRTAQGQPGTAVTVVAPGGDRRAAVVSALPMAPA